MFATSSIHDIIYIGFNYIYKLKKSTSKETSNRRITKLEEFRDAYL